MTDRWALADLRGTSIMDPGRTGAVAERNGRRIAEAAGLGEHASMPAREHAGMSATPPDGWLHRLMVCDGWSGRRLDPEEQLSAETAAELRRLTLAGDLAGTVWTIHRVEVPIGGRIGAMLQRLCRCLGVIPGSSDLVATWGGGSGWIELKVLGQPDLLDLRQDGTARAPSRTYMRPIQRDFREWCVSNGVRHEVCRSVPEVTGALRRWGRLL